MGDEELIMKLAALPISFFWIAAAAAASTLLRTPKSERSSRAFRWRLALFGVAVTVSLWMDVLGF